jgi:hypothetical protein
MYEEPDLTRTRWPLNSRDSELKTEYSELFVFTLRDRLT